MHELLTNPDGNHTPPITSFTTTTDDKTGMNMITLNLLLLD